MLKIKYDMIDKEKIKLTKAVKDPSSMYVDEISKLERKIELLERNNREREEKYRQICINANSSYLNKEIESLTKRFDKERQDLKHEISSKNKEIDVMKNEFSSIIVELEELKLNKRIK